VCAFPSVRFSTNIFEKKTFQNTPPLIKPKAAQGKNPYKKEKKSDFTLNKIFKQRKKHSLMTVKRTEKVVKFFHSVKCNKKAEYIFYFYFFTTRNMI
jgi:hypothetical protein